MTGRVFTEQQLEVISAHAYLRFDMARNHGLIAGGPDIDVDHLRQIVAKGLADGFAAREDQIVYALGCTLHIHANDGEHHVP